MNPIKRPDTPIYQHYVVIGDPLNTIPPTPVSSPTNSQISPTNQKVSEFFKKWIIQYITSDIPKVQND